MSKSMDGLKVGEEVVTSANFPHRRRKQSQERRCKASAATRSARSHDRRLIRWSARNVFLVGLATVFVTLAGVYAVSRVPLDAIPDLSDVQVIVYTEYPGQAPQVVEDQVTYPLTTAMLTRAANRGSCAASPSSASRSSTSSSRTAPTSTGRVSACSNI